MISQISLIKFNTLNMRPTRLQHAFTLVELMIAVAILAVAVGLIIPSLGPNDRSRLLAAANLIASEIELAQSLSIATPEDRAVVKFDLAAPAGVTWWIAPASAPDTPIMRPYSTTPHVTTLGVGDAADLGGIGVTLVGTADTIGFEEFGRPDPPAEIRVRLTNAAGTLDLVLSESTGFLSMVDQ